MFEFLLQFVGIHGGHLEILGCQNGSAVRFLAMVEKRKMTEKVTLLELDELPATIVFLNSGVKLAVKESPVLEDVQTLESRGVEILVCGTCLNHFELIEQLGAGIVSNMYSITEALMAAGKVISP